jgi:hypothetical protein
VIVNEVWSITFENSDVRSVSPSLPDNRKVYVRIGDVEFGIIFQDVFVKHQFLELLAFKSALNENIKIRLVTWNMGRRDQPETCINTPERLVPNAETFDLIAFAFQEVPRS